MGLLAPSRDALLLPRDQSCRLGAELVIKFHGRLITAAPSYEIRTSRFMSKDESSKDREKIRLPREIKTLPFHYKWMHNTANSSSEGEHCGTSCPCRQLLSDAGETVGDAGLGLLPSFLMFRASPRPQGPVCILGRFPYLPQHQQGLNNPCGGEQVIEIGILRKKWSRQQLTQY